MDNVIAKMQLTLAMSGDNSSGSQAELGVASDSVSLQRGVNYADGVGDDQCDQVWHDKISITASTTLDMNNDSLKNGLGEVVSLTKLKGLYIKNLTGGNLTIGAAAAEPVAIFGTPADDTLVLKDGGDFLWTAPKAAGLDVSVNGQLKLAHDAGGAQNVEVIIVGVE